MFRPPTLPLSPRSSSPRRRRQALPVRRTSASSVPPFAQRPTEVSRYSRRSSFNFQLSTLDSLLSSFPACPPSRATFTWNCRKALKSAPVSLFPATLTKNTRGGCHTRTCSPVSVSLTQYSSTHPPTRILIPFMRFRTVSGASRTQGPVRARQFVYPERLPRGSLSLTNHQSPVTSPQIDFSRLLPTNGLAPIRRLNGPNY